MSVVGFTSKTDSVNLDGSERHWAMLRIFELFWSCLDVKTELFNPEAFLTDPVLGIVNGAGHGFGTPDALRLAFRTSETTFSYEGGVVPTDDVVINTAWAVGSNTVKFMIQMDYQCELNCFVEPKNRTWLAEIIGEGRRSGLMRPEAGWESVAEMLRFGDDSQVILSSSLGGASTLDYWVPMQERVWTPTQMDPDYGEEAQKEWEDLPIEKRWQLFMAALYKKNEKGMRLEISPEMFAIHAPFGPLGGVTAFDIRRYADSLAHSRV